MIIQPPQEQNQEQTPKGGPIKLRPINKQNCVETLKNWFLINQKSTNMLNQWKSGR